MSGRAPRGAGVILLTLDLLHASGYNADPMHLAPSSPIRRALLVPGQAFHGSEVAAKDGDRWLGLMRTQAGYRAAMATLRISPTKDPVLDSGSELTGKSIAGAGPSQPVFFLKGFDRLAGRAVPTAFEGHLRLTPSGGHFYFAGRKLELAAAPTGKRDEFPPGQHVEISQVNLTEGERTTPLPLVVTEYNQVAILWVGDLDGDGEPDLLFEDSGDNWVSTRLFLSSASLGTMPLAEVGQFFRTGC